MYKLLLVFSRSHISDTGLPASKRLPGVPPNRPERVFRAPIGASPARSCRADDSCASCAAVIREIRRHAEMQSHGALSVRSGREHVRLRLATNAAYADHRWNLYGTFRTVTVTHAGQARLLIQ